MVLQCNRKEPLELPVTKHHITGGSHMLRKYLFINESIHLILSGELLDFFFFLNFYMIVQPPAMKQVPKVYPIYILLYNPTGQFLGI